LTTSLTVIIAVIVAIIGSSFFYNYRFNRKEYELLTKETTNKIEEVQKQLLKDSRAEISKMSENNQKVIEKEFEQISKTYQTNYDTIKDSLKTIVTAFKQNIDESIHKQSEEFKSLEEQVEELEERAKDDIKVNEKNLKIDILDIKAELYFMKEWYSLALSNYVDQAILCIETNKTWLLKYVAGDIIKSIERVLEKNDTMTSSTKLNIEKILPKLPSYISDKKKKIEDSYKKITIKEVEFLDRGLGNGLFSGLLDKK
jgi:exonuclease VII large subunit